MDSSSQREEYRPDSSSSSLLLSRPQGGPMNASTSPFHAPLVQAPPSLRQAHSNPGMGDSRYVVSALSGNHSVADVSSIAEKYSLSPDPIAWGAELSPHHQEPDDYLHNPDPRRDQKRDGSHNVFTFRGLSNLGCLIILGVSLLALFAGYPIISHFTTRTLSTLGGFNIGGINGTGQVPELVNNWGVIDADTPVEFHIKKSFEDGSDLRLVFSDEFNTDGRTFYPGDDPYWEAVDLHYWQTNNLEWYDPAAITTRDGALEITLSKKQTHGLDYQGGLLSSWNKFCFTGGYIESAVSLPGISNVIGLWPAVWTLGNLGRAGYGASLEGMWPYTYDSCDVGTAPNQTINGRPFAATENGDEFYEGALSFLPGQRLSRCTCPGESHPGPVHSDGTYVGRSAPEIDVLEAQVTGDPPSGFVSQSAQWAPFNAGYKWLNNSENLQIPNPDVTVLNEYRGGAFQQATSGLSTSDPDCYQLATGCFSLYGFEYKPGFDDAYIHWISQGTVSWSLRQAGMAADPQVEIAARPIPQEPMYMILNLGISENFGGFVDFENLIFPAVMRVDYVRVYQPADSINVGCDPDDFPTQAYINQYIEAYTNPNLTTWKDDYRQPFPKNNLTESC